MSHRYLVIDSHNGAYLFDEDLSEKDIIKNIEKLYESNHLQKRYNTYCVVDLINKKMLCPSHHDIQPEFLGLNELKNIPDLFKAITMSETEYGKYIFNRTKNSGYFLGYYAPGH